MEDIRDCRGRLVCKADAPTGIVEMQYKGLRTETRLSPGSMMIIEREGVVTTVTRTHQPSFSVESHDRAA